MLIISMFKNQLKSIKIILDYKYNSNCKSQCLCWCFVLIVQWIRIIENQNKKINKIEIEDYKIMIRNVGLTMGI